MAKSSILNSIFSAALKKATGTTKSKTTTVSKTTGSTAKTNSASEAAKNLSPAMKKKADEVWNKPISTPKGWTRTTGKTYSSS